MVTTSKFSNYARFVGRVGALAVALGIGVAVTDGGAVASADTGTSSSGTNAGSSEAPSKAPSKNLDKSSKKGSTASTETSGSAPVRAPRKPSFGDGTRLAKRFADAINTATKPVKSLPSAAASLPNTVVNKSIPTLTPNIEASSTPPTPKLKSELKAQLTPRLPETPVSPVHDIGLAALLGWSRREGRPGLVPVGHVTTPEARSQVASEVTTKTTEATSVLATEDQLAAERQVSQIVNTPIVQLAKVVLKVAWYVEAAKNFSAVGGPDFKNLSQLDQAATEFANQSATEFVLLNSNDPKLLLQVNPPHSWNGQDAGGTRIWYDNPDTVYRFTGVNGASTYQITGTVAGYDPADPSTHPTSANTNFSVLTGINGVTAANLNGEQLSIRDDGTFTIVVSPDAPPAVAEKGMNYLQAPANSTILATRNTLGDWNTETPMTLSIEKVTGPPSSLFSQLGGFAIPVIGQAAVQNPVLQQVVSAIPAFAKTPLLLSSTETALLMLVTGISGENTYMSVATATGAPNTLSQPAHNAQFLSTQLQSAGYFQLKDDEAIVITVDPGDAEYFVVPVTNDWTITNDTRNQQTSLNNSQAVKNSDGTYTIVVSKTDPGVANWVSTGGLNQGTISMRFQGVDPAATNLPKVTTQVVAASQVKAIVAGDPNTTPEQLDYDRAQQIADRQAGYDRRYTV